MYQAMTSSPEAVDRTLRAYSKKHRVYVFREFLLETYGDYLNRSIEPESATGRPIVLDVAGGKGDLSWLLRNVDGWESVVADPRRTLDRIVRTVEFLKERPEECAVRAVRDRHTYQPIAALMPQLQAKDYCLTSPMHLRIFVDQDLMDALRASLLCLSRQQDPHGIWNVYWEKAVRRTQGFVTPTGKNDVVALNNNSNDNRSVTEGDRALQVLLQTRLVLGFHPDQATDYCFELAALLQVPVCVVPCCVFPSEFPHRLFIPAASGTAADEIDKPTQTERSNSDNMDSGSSEKVVKYHHLIQYLRQQYPQLLMDTLPFIGTTTARNIVLYTLP